MLLTRSFKRRILLFINLFIFFIFVGGVFLAYNLNKKLFFDELKNLSFLNYKTMEKPLAESIIYDDIYTVFSIIEGVINNSNIFSNITVIDKNNEYITDAKVTKKVPNTITDEYLISYNITINQNRVGSIIFEINKTYISTKLNRSLLILIFFHIIAFLIVSTILSKFINYLLTPLTDLTNKLESISDIASIPKKIDFDKKDPKEITKLKEILIQLSQNLSKQIEKNIEQEKEIIRKDKIVSISMMAAGLAHHLKNPIMTIKLLLNPLKKEIKTEDSQNDIEVIDSELNRMLNIINNFMLLSKETKITFEEILATNLFETLTKRVSGLKGVKFEFIYDHIKFVSNKEKLIMVFENLISNSINAGADQITIKANQTDEKTIFEYYDNGSGIPEEIKDKIFIPFFTTKKSGTGLGLAYVENLITSLNGIIYYDKNYSKGAKFVIELKHEKKGTDH